MALDQAAGFVYRTLLKPAPLRKAVNTFLLLLPKQITLPEGILSLNPRDPVISGALALGVYERFELTLFRHFVEEGSNVLDIGANVGLYTVIAAGRVGATGRVLACEPEPVNFSLLSQNAAQNNFSNVHCYQCAVADRAGTMELYLSESNKGHHTLVNDEGSQDLSQKIEVKTVTGDELLQEAGVSNIDVIKIDIEGAEPLALTGLEHTLSSPHLALFMEFSPHSIRVLGFIPEAILADLKGKGFSIFEINGKQEKLVRVEDPKEFTSRFMGTQYANLLCLKGRVVEKARAYLL